MKKCGIGGYFCNQFGRAVGTKLNTHPEFIEQLKNLHVDNSNSVYGQKPIPVPDEFDGSRVWKSYFPKVRDQGTCGACWAITTTDTLATRLAIYTKGKIKVNLSPAGMLLCNLGAEYEVTAAMSSLEKGDPYDINPSRNGSNDSTLEWIARERERASKIGCGGDTLISGWQYLMRFGVPTEKCVPYHDIRWRDELYAAKEQRDPSSFALFNWPKRKQVFDIAKYTLNQPSVIVNPNASSQQFGESSSVSTFPSCTETMGHGYDMCALEKNVPMKLFAAGCWYIVPGTPNMRDKVRYPNGGSEYEIRREIYHFGPVSTGFSVQNSFMAWDGRSNPVVWENVPGEPEIGGHSVILLGWGSSPELGDYWIARNSWGKSWGKKGLFYIRRGNNTGGLEENVVVGVPDIPGLRLALDWPIWFDPYDYFMKHVWHVSSSGYKYSYIERALLNAENPPPDLSQELIPAECWPNFGKLVAAMPSTIHFPFGVGYKMDPRYNKNLRKGIFILAATGILIGGLTYYFSEYEGYSINLKIKKTK